MGSRSPPPRHRRSEAALGPWTGDERTLTPPRAHERAFTRRERHRHPERDPRAALEATFPNQKRQRSLPLEDRAFETRGHKRDDPEERRPERAGFDRVGSLGGDSRRQPEDRRVVGKYPSSSFESRRDSRTGDRRFDVSDRSYPPAERNSFDKEKFSGSRTEFPRSTVRDYSDRDGLPRDQLKDRRTAEDVRPQEAGAYRFEDTRSVDGDRLKYGLTSSRHNSSDFAAREERPPFRNEDRPPIRNDDDLRDPKRPKLEEDRALRKFSVYVARLPDHFDEKELREFFWDCGSILSISVMQKDPSKRYAFVNFGDHESREKALKLNGTRIGDLSIVVEIPSDSRRRRSPPRRR